MIIISYSSSIQNLHNVCSFDCLEHFLLFGFYSSVSPMEQKRLNNQICKCHIFFIPVHFFSRVARDLSEAWNLIFSWSIILVKTLYFNFLNFDWPKKISSSWLSIHFARKNIEIFQIHLMFLFHVEMILTVKIVHM